MSSTGGAIQQLIYAKNGVQDTFLTGNPQHNFIKQVYKRYDNFAVERINIQPTTVVDFGKPITFQVKKLGQFLKKVYFNMTLPKLIPSSGTYAGWTNQIGYAIIDYIDFKINGLKVDTIYGLWLMIWNELSGTPNDNSGYLTGSFDNTSSLKSNALTETNYFVDLTFWFSENIGSALPLLCLTQSNFIEFVLYLRPFEECIVYDGITPPNTVSITNSYLATDQIFVDDIFAKKFMGEKHTYIIKQHQYQYDSIFGQSKNLQLDFNHPCNQLVFVLRETESELNNDWFNFSLRNTTSNQPVTSLLIESRLLLDGKPRNDFLTSKELSSLNSYTYYNKTVENFIMTMPFCNNPINWIPSGSVNFSIISNAELQLNLSSNNSSSVHVFATNFNFLTIENSYVKIEFDT
jgi:hypothetical protein